MDLSVPPHITPFAFEDEVFAGDGVQVTCYVSRGDLPLSITWTFNGVPISSATSKQTGIVASQSNSRTSILSVESVSANHSGEYSCEASNRAATVEHVAVLMVNGTFLVV